MKERNEKSDYPAKTGYRDSAAASDYELRPHYKGLLGPYRRFREKQGIQSAVQQFMRDSVVLDCPCGNGRWFELLSMRASRIVGYDISEAMVEAAAKRHIAGINVSVRLCDAEKIDLDDNSVDHVFSYALMKHLPPDIKIIVMREFARVSRGRIAVSFGVFNLPGKMLWKLKCSHEWPVGWAEIERLADEASLKIGTTYRSSLPVIGMETIVVFERKPC